MLNHLNIPTNLPTPRILPSGRTDGLDTERGFVRRFTMRLQYLHTLPRTRNNIIYIFCSQHLNHQ